MLSISINTRLSSEAFLEWVQDTLTENDLYDIAVELWTWFAIWTFGWVLIEKLKSKYGAVVATKLWSKAVPVLWWWLTAVAAGTVVVQNEDYIRYCKGSEYVDWKPPSYYCGKLTVNTTLTFAGLEAGKKASKGIFKRFQAWKWIKTKVFTKLELSEADAKLYYQNRYPENIADPVSYTHLTLPTIYSV